MKQYIAGLVAAVLTFGALSAGAQQTQAELAASVANTAVVQDQSQLPDQDNRRGYLTAWLDIERLGTKTGDVDVGPYIPKGTLIVGGYAHVVRAILPATATAATSGAVSVQAAGDMLATGTSLGSTGIKYLVPSAAGTFVTGLTLQTANIGSNGNAVVTNVVAATAANYGGAPVLVTGSQSKVTFNLGSQVAPTSGVVLLVLDLLQVQ